MVRPFRAALALLLTLNAGAAYAGVLPLNVLADNDSAFYEYYSDGFARMDQFASTRPTNQNFHAISNPAVQYGQGYDAFPNDRNWRFGSITYDESGLVGGTGAAPITGFTFNLLTDPAAPTYVNFTRYTVNTIIDTTPVTGTVQVAGGLPTGVALSLNLHLDVVKPLGSTMTGTYPGTLTITDDQFEFQVEGTQNLDVFQQPLPAFKLKWDFSGQLRNLAVDNGDYDGNLRVDGSDFLAWQRELGQTATPAGSGADGDADGTVDADDLSYVTSQFGFGIGAGSVPAIHVVPEPATSAAGMMAIAALLLRRRSERGTPTRR